MTHFSHSRRNITFSPALFALSDVTFEDSGQYRCHAQNENATGESDPVNVTVYGGGYNWITTWYTLELPFIYDKHIDITAR